MATSPTLIPEPGVIPDIVPDSISDADIVSMISSAQANFYIGVVFVPGGKVYTYICPMDVHVGSVVLVPGNSYKPQPQAVDVVTLNPHIPPGVPIKRVIAVVS